MIHKQPISTFLLLMILPLTAQENPAQDWIYSMDISQGEGQTKYTSLFLDKEVYANLDYDFDSIRIIDEENNFVPYYFDNQFQKSHKSLKNFSSTRTNVDTADLTRLEFEQTNQATGDLTINENVFKTIYDFQILPQEETIMGQKLALDIVGENYSKQVVLWGRNEKTQWERIGTDTIYDFDGYKRTEVDLGGIEYYAFYRVIIYDNRGQVDIQSLKLVYDQEQWETESFKKTNSIEFSLSTEEKESIIRIKNENNLRLLSLIVDAESPFKRSYTLYELGDEDKYLMGGKLYNFQFENREILSNSIELNTEKQLDEIKIVIQNEDNPPLQINKIQAEYLVDKIVFPSEQGKNYRLLFGNEGVRVPVYDIEDFKQYIKEEEVSESTLTNVQILKDVPTKKKGIPFQTIFNIIITVVALGLALGIALKLKPQK